MCGSRVTPSGFRENVVAGLAARPRAIPARWLYDARGSALFEEITRLPEYYPTRTERALLARCAGEVAATVGPGRAVVELGSGSAAKTPLLLEAVAPAAYVPVDIAAEVLRESAALLGARFPDLAIHPQAADFMAALPLPPEVAELPKLGFFPGSTIGNLVASSAVDLLRRLRAALGKGAYLFIGVDMVKPVAALLAAYDDAAGVTAAFNLNLLARINRELGGDIDLAAFRHRAIWNEAASRIEMHLEAVRDVAFTVAGERFAIAAGETIHSENSHKYGDRDTRFMLAAGGWSVRACWIDEACPYGLYLAEAEPERAAP